MLLHVRAHAKMVGSPCTCHSRPSRGHGRGLTGASSTTIAFPFPGQVRLGQTLIRGWRQLCKSPFFLKKKKRWCCEIPEKKRQAPKREKSQELIVVPNVGKKTEYRVKQRPKFFYIFYVNNSFRNGDCRMRVRMGNHTGYSVSSCLFNANQSPRSTVQSYTHSRSHNTRKGCPHHTKGRDWFGRSR